MVLRKQTVWLLTMLAVMVVLSGYYLVKGPGEAETPAIGQEPPSVAGVELHTQQTDAPPTVEETTGLANELATGELPLLDGNTSESFQGYKMRREAMLQQQRDEQMAIVVNPDATPQAIAEAQAKHAELSQLEQDTLALEEQLKAQGYKDAVVFINQDRYVNVLVQDHQLEPAEVVNIIAMVKQQMNVPGNQVTVKFQQ